ncbi:MAG: excinuclease ABC subunit UvrC [Bordetella sp.]|nr:MAG: excinuclease ABC subunit UvrC [Bordetella sp.]
MINDIDIKCLLKTLPSLPGVYKFLDIKNDVIYVGKSCNLKKRISSYFQKKLTDLRSIKMLEKIAKIQVTITRSESEALILESNLIKKFLPKYNILFRDDKSYSYLLISNHDWPRISSYKGKRINNDGSYFGPFPSSTALRKTIEILQKTFQIRICEDSAFSNRSRPCLLYQIQHCSAPCVRAITSEVYKRNAQNAIDFLNCKTKKLMSDIALQMENAAKKLQFEEAIRFRDQIDSLSSILRKQTMKISDDLNIDIIAIAIEENKAYISLGLVRNGQHLGSRSIFPEQIEGKSIEQILEAFFSHYYFMEKINFPDLIICSHFFSYLNVMNFSDRSTNEKFPKVLFQPKGIYRSWLDQEKQNVENLMHQIRKKSSNFISKNIDLAKILNLDIEKTKSGQIRIECFDISHSAGKFTEASCVVFKNHSLQPSLYRRYNIEDVNPCDDYSAINQVLTRRFSKISNKIDLPDLVLIDGGKGQVEIARQVFSRLGINSSILVGISKNKNRKAGMEKLIFADHREPLILGQRSQALLLMINIRDEAHRFAINSMKMRRIKTFHLSKLEEISKIGKNRRQNLLNRFGSFSGVVSANIDELTSVHGISYSLARHIYDHLHK